MAIRADLLHPVDGSAVEPFLNGEVRHGGRRGRARPMLLTRLGAPAERRFHARSRRSARRVRRQAFENGTVKRPIAMEPAAIAGPGLPRPS